MGLGPPLLKGERSCTAKIAGAKLRKTTNTTHHLALMFCIDSLASHTIHPKLFVSVTIITPAVLGDRSPLLGSGRQAVLNRDTSRVVHRLAGAYNLPRSQQVGRKTVLAPVAKERTNKSTTKRFDKQIHTIGKRSSMRAKPCCERGSEAAREAGAAYLIVTIPSNPLFHISS